MSEDDGYEPLRQKHIDQMSAEEFSALSRTATSTLDPDDEDLKLLENQGAK